MALYALADLHLSLSTGKAKSMEIFPGWQNYEARIAENWRRVVAADDTVVIAGDFCWAMQLAQGLADFAFVNALPGKKLLLKGNHDYWWATKAKMEGFFAQNNLSTLQIVHNSAYRVGDIAVCGTRGWFYDAEQDADRKVLAREAIRLRTSIRAAKQLGGEPVVFLHYPPVSATQICEEMVSVLLEEDIHRCYYGHIHTKAQQFQLRTQYQNIQFQLISADYLDFCPLLVEI